MDAPSSSRPSQPDVAPVEHRGIRYEQDGHDDRFGDQPGGYLVAIDARTGERLWRLMVYEVPNRHGEPSFARYFRAIRLVSDGSALEIENEAGAVYRVDLKTRTSTHISGPPANAPLRPASSPKPQPQ